MLRPGDVVTHSFGGFEDVLIDESGKVRDGFKEAARRGVVFDVGHGGGGFSFTNAERAIADGLPPGNISTDLHQGSIGGPVFDMVTTMSKFLYLGLSLDEVVRLTTQSTAAIMGMGDTLGTLAVGAAGDATILRLAEGRFPLVDRVSTSLRFQNLKWEAPVRIEARQKLEHVDTVRGGSMYRPWLDWNA
jgi:dihydroorotase